MSPRMKKLLRFGVVGGVVGFVALQFAPVGRWVPLKDIGTNPPGRFALGAPPDVTAILERACMDCHSNETKWPLYARLAPGSWLMARDVHTGRNHMNFSEWGDHDEDERQDDLETCWEQVESGEMPPWFYVYPLHLKAKLSDGDKATLKAYFLKNTKPGGAKKKDKDAAKE
jgi:hypothetical protein